MNTASLYLFAGVGLVGIGLGGVFMPRHLIRQIMALNVMGAGVFMILLAVARRGSNLEPDPVPHAMVLTGIVVAVSATALALALSARVFDATGRTDLDDDGGTD